MTRVTQKDIKDNYTYDQILKAGPKTEKRTWKHDITYTTLDELISTLEEEHPDVAYKNVHLEADSEYSFGDVFEKAIATLTYEHELSELERFNAGVKILQDREQGKQDIKDKEEHELKELERLKKKFEEK